MQSKYVHLLISPLHFPHESQADIYKVRVELPTSVVLCWGGEGGGAAPLSHVVQSLLTDFVLVCNSVP